MRDADDRCSSYCYGRADNARVRQGQGILDGLEGGAATLLFGSGMAGRPDKQVFLALEQRARRCADRDVLGTAAMAGG